MRQVPNHAFWPDALSLFDAAAVAIEKLTTSAQITDTYLLALAVHHGGALATFDRKLSSAAVIGGASALYIID